MKGLSSIFRWCPVGSAVRLPRSCNSSYACRTEALEGLEHIGNLRAVDSGIAGAVVQLREADENPAAAGR